MFLIKNIFKIHPLVYFFSLFAILMGRFQEYIIISVLILIHELGHFLCAYLLGVEVDCIYIYPLGGISKFYLEVDSPFRVEFLILIMGPIFQTIAYLLLSFFFSSSIIFPIHIGILLFNLLPIYPLDGGRFIQLLFSKIIPYRKSFQVSIIISYIMVIILLFSNTSISINMILTYIFLLIIIKKEEEKIPFYYNSFLFQRYLKKPCYIKSKIISYPQLFYRYYKNIILIKNQRIEEEEYLQKKYGFFGKNY